MARSLARAGGNNGARRYYRKVIEGYPDTKYVKTAREEMDRLPRTDDRILEPWKYLGKPSDRSN